MHIRRWIFVGLLIAAGGYFLYEARGVIFAPTLKIFTPTPERGILGRTQRVMPRLVWGLTQKEVIVTVSNTARLQIAGRTDPYLKVWISGREAQADEKGFFEDNILVWPGYNEIGLKVSDKFGNETRKVLKIVVK